MTRTTLLLALLLLPAALDAAAQERAVIINQTRLDDATVQALEQAYQVQVLDGRYWYDARSGAWGYEGGPVAGLILPGLDLGGPLRADASGGTTSVFVNGRELHVQDVLALQQLVGVVLPGRYWLDAYGNVGYEGGPALLNLAVLAQQASGGGGAGGGNTFYRSGATDIGAGSSGDFSYVMGDGWSVSVGN